MLLSPLAGVVADRFDKRDILRVTQVAMAVPALMLGLLAVTGTANAVGLNSATFNSARLVGLAALTMITAANTLIQMTADPIMRGLLSAVGIGLAVICTQRILGECHQDRLSSRQLRTLLST